MAISADRREQCRDSVRRGFAADASGNEPESHRNCGLPGGEIAPRSGRDGERRAPSLENIAVDVVRKRSLEADKARGDDSRRRGQFGNRGRERTRGKRRRPAEQTIVVLMLRRRAGPRGLPGAQRGTKTGGHSPVGDRGTVIGMVVETGNGELYAERKKRQPYQPYTGCRFRHAVPSIFLFGMDGSSVLMSQSWRGPRRG